MTRNGLVIVALAALVLIGGAWYLFADGKSSAPAAGGPNGKGADRAVAVVTAHPAQKEFAYEVEALGTLRANESVDITAKVADRVAAIHFTEGQQVRKGDLLIELDNTEARADLAAAEAAASDSRSQYKRSQE
ncbi:MAG: biotin/lipoyl-binding protein, partial [Steroidobacteraceae bacterium]